MQHLKNNISLILLSIWLLTGCATSSYKITKQFFRKIELNISPDRILLQCEKISDTEEVYGFMMHVLDEENTVTNIIQTNNLYDNSCKERLEKIGKILKRGKIIYIVTILDLDESRIIDKKMYHFPGIGSFHDNSRVGQYMSIANEHGDCFDAYYGDRKPCPHDEFPIK